MRILTSLLLAAASALTLAHCSHHTNTMNVSPPLPPAEEPSDDTKGAFIGDAGAKP